MRIRYRIDTDKASDRIEAQSDASAELLLTSHGQRMVMHGADVAHDTLDRVAAEEPGGGVGPP